MDDKRRRKLYARIVIPTVDERNNESITLSTIFLPVTVSASIYSEDSVINACNLLKEEQISNKRAILVWDVSVGKILKKMTVKLQKDDGTSKRITVTVNPTGTQTNNSICSSFLGLRQFNIDGENWKIVRTSINVGRIFIDQIDI